MSFDAAIVDRVLALVSAKPSTGARLLALSGAQGSGKSTLAAQVVATARSRGQRAEAVSLDDFYLDRPEREALAAAVHPLLLTRGVPGTHDVAMLRDALAAVRAGRPPRLPTFDKGSDRRLHPGDWRRVDAPLDLLVLEGWCVGACAQQQAALATPINALEALEDADGRWRGHVNDRLAREYAPLWDEFDALAMLRAPSFAVVVEWRDQAEAPLRAAAAIRAMSRSQIARFVMHYQRLTEHALATLPARADLVLSLNSAREVIASELRTTADAVRTGPHPPHEDPTDCGAPP
jgi:D-glycerate 3-kinase